MKPPFAYFGGKTNLAEKIVALLPAHLLALLLLTGCAHPTPAPTDRLVMTAPPVSVLRWGPMARPWHTPRTTAPRQRKAVRASRRRAVVVLAGFTAWEHSAATLAVIRCESGGNPRARNPSSGAGGILQFLPSTWRALGGRGLPEDAPVAEQLYRGYVLWLRDGWTQWVCRP